MPAIPPKASLPVLDSTPTDSDFETSRPDPPPAPPPTDRDGETLRVMSLHALLYCERLFYLEEVEELYVQDDRVMAGRELHASLEQSEQREGRMETMELESPRLGLRGKIDVLKRRDGAWVVYEHKRGKAMKPAMGDPAAPQAWPSDRVQAAAYAMMAEEALGRPIAEARVRYHAQGVTVRVPLDAAARAQVQRAITRARELRGSLIRPQVTDNEKLCVRCSLAPVCLPEEARAAADPDHAAVRLFPEDDRRQTLHVMTPGSRVGRSSDRLVVTPLDGPKTRHPSRGVGSVILHGMAQISTQALRLCTQRDIGVHWITAGGRHTASLTANPGQVQRRLRQYAALSDDATRLRLAKLLVAARLEGHHRYLLRATRSDEHKRLAIADALDSIVRAIRSASRAADADALRGHEGDATRHYWACWDTLLSDNLPPELRFTGRSRRPTTDRLSAILNFGYALLQSAVMRGILASGLEPALGFYHTPRSAAHPLVLDLMELFRLPLWDVPALGSLNRGQWDPEVDFVVTRAKTWLSDTGRRKAVTLFEDRLRETWKHPALDYSLSYSRTLELEARLLEKEWSGEPGLFARMRLR